MQEQTTIVDLTPVRREVMSPAAFRKLVEESPHLIARSRFLAPRIGCADFGNFEVQYSVPVLKRMPLRSW